LRAASGSTGREPANASRCVVVRNTSTWSRSPANGWWAPMLSPKRSTAVGDAPVPSSADPCGTSSTNNIAMFVAGS
jgi:hypothetical protein